MMMMIKPEHLIIIPTFVYKNRFAFDIPRMMATPSMEEVTIAKHRKDIHYRNCRSNQNKDRSDGKLVVAQSKLYHL